MSIVADLFLRFTWTLTLITRVSADAALTAELMHYISPFLAVAELFRRTMWGCFRLENEHLTNHSSSRIGNYDNTSASINQPARHRWTIIVEVLIHLTSHIQFSNIIYYHFPNRLVPS
jgi:hypothetical protein